MAISSGHLVFEPLVSDQVGVQQTGSVFCRDHLDLVLSTAVPPVVGIKDTSANDTEPFRSALVGQTPGFVDRGIYVARD
ncbi:hypothetical protein RvY_11302 [Ramazzottius varieornatus]|uniref:Uncharacterized protein n=1 Tax=Ramazzottius varieornatus TaxID=947166 RepID=A0A1D1VPI9_RAMVA|nr:hypothetical protein RvY_11302 [Ramazzottius varieornatus]